MKHISELQIGVEVLALIPLFIAEQFFFIGPVVIRQKTCPF
jgi:hypothetical protein